MTLSSSRSKRLFLNNTTFQPSSTQSTSAMAPAPESRNPSSVLSATYTGPNSLKSFSHGLASASVSTTEEKTSYLGALRASIVKLQDECNIYLTTKMEEEQQVHSSSAGAKIDEKAEEDNYGEEDVELDA